MHSDPFGDNFVWGVSASALQTEGAATADGKGLSIWDSFSKIRNNDSPEIASDFYNRYKNDIKLVSELHIPNFRISLSWPRLMPNGKVEVNQKGIDFYNRVIDACLENSINPWVTLYHWDLPHALENHGGWTNRDIVDWFGEYVVYCAKWFGDRVRYWMILNEPMVFTGAGYFMGVHAPGKKGLKNFLPAVHHAVLCQSQGFKLIKANLPQSLCGTTISCSHITPCSDSVQDANAAKRVDAMLNRLFIEPSLGLGYPVEEINALRKIEKYFKPGDEEIMQASFDFIGIQNYTREVVKHAFYIPYLRARLIPANQRKVYHTGMNWEVYPEAIYEMIKKYSAYNGIKKIIITENGAAFPDVLDNGKVHDIARISYLKQNLEQVLRAKNEALNVGGYFVWSLTDNFEWTEGYAQRFGLVYVDFPSQQRIVKDSGFWYRDFLNGKEKEVF